MTGLRSLVDNLMKHLRALETLGQPVESWDTLLIYLMSNKLDNVTRREWEKRNTSSSEMPTLKQLTKFLNEKCNLLETLNSNVTATTSNIKSKNFLTLDHKKAKCSFCFGQHFVNSCQLLLKVPAEKRYQEIKAKNLCTNCLRFGHSNNVCNSGSCKKCGKRHHTLLHVENRPTNAESSETSKTEDTRSQRDTCTHAQTQYNNQVLLSTAVVQIKDRYGQYHNCRALLDSGSTVHLISQNIVNKLQLQKLKTDISVSGLNQSVNNLTYCSKIELRSRSNSYQATVTCCVIDNITDNLPSTSIEKTTLKIPPNIHLADPEFDISGKIDLLIGAELFWQLIKEGQIQLGKSKPILQNTVFGWIVSGLMPNTTRTRSSQQCNFISNTEIDTKLTKFWEIEEFSKKMPLTAEELATETHFKETTIRSVEGRFIVKLPLKHSSELLGDSKETAIKRFLSMEQKLNGNSELKQQYTEFINEYINLQHMTKITESLKDSSDSSSYYIPHHFVQKNNSLTTKLRVVFDASSKTTSGYSLNDIQMVGAKIQEDLISIILRFRSHQYILAGDITKMYRQILVHPDDRKLQRVLWRSDSSEPIETYELNTITYGMSCAPFLAVRCLQEIAIQHKTEFPEASRVILDDFYVDDLLTGTSDPKHLVTLYKDISTILNSAGFSLNKWISNEPNTLTHIQNTQSNVIINMGNEEETYSLGLLWYSSSDVLQYQTKITQFPNLITKRQILSTVASIYDPLGLIGPAIIKGKILLQKLWQKKTSWDSPVPTELSDEWKTFASQLHILNEIQLPRFVLCKDPVHIELHGFGDASEQAYGACVYVRSVNNTGKTQVSLLTAKSKVAPLKNITIPRLELCACVLLSRLVNLVTQAWRIKFNKIYLWSDSTIALAWLQGEPTKWKIFVANRVAEIQNLTDKHDWRHIPTHENSADVISRGLGPLDLKNCEPWWNGPKWLLQPTETWPTHTVNIDLLQEYNKEFKKQSCPILTINNDQFNIFNKFSTFIKLQRVTAYILRFKSNALLKQNLKGPLTCIELNNALTILIKLVQLQTFSSEISNLLKYQSVNRNSNLLSLNPFIDDKELLRVGGRLAYSNFDQNKKHPIILPGKHKFTELLIKYEHLNLLHSGPQAVLASLREKYWILSARNSVRKLIRNCTICFKVNPKPNIQYLMADLPAERTTPGRPFLNVATDFCGPFNLKDRKTRNYKLTKAYVCVFVCMSTKAIHAELVSELTTKAFLACLRRFISRRGKCANIISDNGKNFVGAQRELERFFKASRNDIETDLNQSKINWHFLPPKAPHFGGIHEAGVKSIKYHIKRVVGSTNLTFEEFLTILNQVEACVNSRPLYPMSSDPNDPNPLTPAHFLIGDTLTGIPEGQHDDQSCYTSRFHHCQKMVQDIWRRWCKEYVSELQVRTKWKTKGHNNLSEGDMVIIKEDNLALFKWNLGRVVQLHPGQDGIVRVVSVKTGDGVLKRPVTKLCLLPNEL